MARPATDTTLRDETTFYDPTPLFLPTRWNAAPPPIELREPGTAFRDFSPKLGFAEVELRLEALSLPKPVTAPPSPAERPGDVLALPAPGALMAGFGRSDAPVVPLPGRAAHVEITTAESGRRVFARDLPDAARPPGGRSWDPLVFTVAVDAAGLVGALVLTTRSGVDEVDAYFQGYLARTLRVGERLAPGFYKIRVGP